MSGFQRKRSSVLAMKNFKAGSVIWSNVQNENDDILFLPVPDLATRKMIIIIVM